MASNPRLAFVEACTVDRDQYRAAALVTDELAEPVEFRCTSPVRPNRFQKILWGGRLNGHVLVSVLGKPLLAALSAPPTIVLVRQKLFLDLRPRVGCPVVQLVAAEEAGASPGTTVPGLSPAVYLRSHGNRADDLTAALAAVRELAEAVHPFEPFARLLQAVAAVHQDENPVKAV